MMRRLSTLVVMFFLSFGVQGQTNVSGPMTTNTTWTLSGSPYVVLDTVMISAGVTLTIQPGVVVKFADGGWIFTNSALGNAARIIAVGTSTDSITFTSNSLTPTPGCWVGIYLNGGDDSSSIFNYCNFSYADIAIRDNQFVLDVLTINNCRFSNNLTGLRDYGRIIRINSCNFEYNVCGLLDIKNSTIRNCNISNNQIGLDGNSTNCCGNTIEDCTIDSNIIGLRGLYQGTGIHNCQIRYNQYGVIFNYSNNLIMKGSLIDSNVVAGVTIAAGDVSIDSCQIRYNGVGILDSGGTSQNLITRNRIENNYIGIQLSTANDDIHCNRICNNTSYDLKSMSANAIAVSNNYWCTSDSSSTQSIIFDGSDSVGLGVVNFMPIDTIQCYNCSNIIIGLVQTPANFPQQNGSATVFPTGGQPPYTYSWNTSPIQTTQTATGLGVGSYTACVTDSMGCVECINIYIPDSNTLYLNEAFLANSFTMFPNPASDYITIEMPANISTAEIKIFSIIGDLERALTTTESKVDVDISGLTSGVHIIQVAVGDKFSRLLLVKQ